MITDRNIVCIGSNWFEHPTSKHHVMRRLAQHNHVLWVNFHASRRPQLTRADTRHILRRLRQAMGGVRRVAPGIDMLSPLLAPLPESATIRRLNDIILGRQIARALARLPRRPVQLWLFTPDVPGLIRRLRPERTMYYCVDDFAAFSGFNTDLVETLERQTMAASDVVITTAQRLFDERYRHHPRTHLITHGVDFAHFAKAPGLPADAIPDALLALPRPVLGYMGLISDWVDDELLATLAARRPGWSIVLLGNHTCNVDRLLAAQNVHLLGPQPYEALPAFCRGFDIGLIPFRCNRLTRSINPIKLREYLAAGLPVVSTPMQEVRRYAPAVQVAETPDAFEACCEQALLLATDGQPETRQALVRAEGWDARVEHLSKLVMDRTPTSCPGADHVWTDQPSSAGAPPVPVKTR